MALTLYPLQHPNTYKLQRDILIMADKWYNSVPIQCLGIGLGAGTACLGLGIGMGYTNNEKQTQPVIQEADINGNGISDKFYIIDEKIAVTELDGKSISQSLEKKILEK